MLQYAAAFAIVISANSHTSHIKLPERSKVLTVTILKNGSCIIYSKYGAFDLLKITTALQRVKR
jgi:hypothetical protein